jgi:CRISPR-associated exonuclease Cas4
MCGSFDNLVVAVLGLALLLFVLLSMWAGRERQTLGLEQGTIVAADDARLAMPTLRSDRLGLIGRPDHLLSFGHALIPVEQKPNARRAQRSHTLQLAAQCLLVQEVYGIRPPYGLLVLAKGVQERVPFTPALEARLLDTMGRMRDLLAADAAPGPPWVAPKCRACGFHDTCWS